MVVLEIDNKTSARNQSIPSMIGICVGWRIRSLNLNPYLLFPFQNLGSIFRSSGNTIKLKNKAHRNPAIPPKNLSPLFIEVRNITPAVVPAI